MAVLTWKNVDAPNMSGAGALLESANNSFQNAMGTLQKAADRSQMQQRAAASARMLQGLAGVKNADDVAAYLAGQDATMLTDESMKIALGQADVLQGRAVKEIELQNARGDLDWETNSRQGSLGAANLLAQAAAAAQAGNADEANRIASSGNNPYVQMALNDGRRDYVGDAASRQSLDENRYSFGRTVENDENADIVTQKISDLRGSANNVAEAREALLKDSTLTAKQKEDGFAKLGAMDDSAFNFADPNTPASFSILGDNDSAARQQVANMQIDAINKDINAQLQSLPSYNYNNHLSNLTAVQGDRESGKQTGDEREVGQGFFDPAKYLTDTVGISTGYFQRNIENQLQNLADKATTANGRTVSKAEVAAAIASTYEAGGLANFGDKYLDETKVLNLLAEMKDPKRGLEASAREAEIKNSADSIKSSSAQVDRLLAKAQNQMAKGQTAAAEKTRAEAAQAQKALMEGINAYNEKHNPAPETEAPVTNQAPAQAPTQRAVAPTAPARPTYEPGQLDGYDEFGEAVYAPDDRNSPLNRFLNSITKENPNKGTTSIRDQFEGVTPEELLRMYR